jgi:hypothetical protein
MPGYAGEGEKVANKSQRMQGKEISLDKNKIITKNIFNGGFICVQM